MALNTAADTNLPTSDAPAGFFKLPRELRDEIYGMMYHEIEQKVCKSRSDTDEDMFIIHARAPVPQLRLLSRQFKRAYDENCPTGGCVSLSTNIRFGKWGPLWGDLGCPAPARRSTELVVSFTPIRPDLSRCISSLKCIWCQEEDSLAYGTFCAATSFARDMPLLQCIRFVVHSAFPDLGCPQQVRCYGLHQFMTYLSEDLQVVSMWSSPEVTDLSKFEICWVGHEGEDTEAAVTYATWTFKDGLKVDVEAAERCGKKVNRF